MLTLTIIKLLGDVLHIPGFYVVHDILTTGICIAWIILIVCTSMAFWRREIFYEGDAITGTNGAGSAGMIGVKSRRIVGEKGTVISEKSDGPDLEAGRDANPNQRANGSPPVGGGTDGADPGGKHERDVSGLSKRTLVAGATASDIEELA